MKNYFIEDAKYEILDDFGPCGPGFSTVVGFIKFRIGRIRKYIVLEEFDGFPQFYLFGRDPYQKIMENRYDNKFINFMLKHEINNFDGIDLPCDYDCLIDSLNHAPSSSDSVRLIKLLLSIVRFSEKRTKEIIENSVGKTIRDVALMDPEDIICFDED